MKNTATINSPFSEKYSDLDDKMLVQKSIKGDKKSLEKLIHKHQAFVYNLAWKMCGTPDTAADITQEVLIKVITNLTKFQYKSSFNTWLYRITINHVLNVKKSALEKRVIGFTEYGNILDSIPNIELSILEQMELTDTIKDSQFRCLSAMLLCLTTSSSFSLTCSKILISDCILIGK